MRFRPAVSTVEAIGVWFERMLAQGCPRQDYAALPTFGAMLYSQLFLNQRLLRLCCIGGRWKIDDISR